MLKLITLCLFFSLTSFAVEMAPHGEGGEDHDDGKAKAARPLDETDSDVTMVVDDEELKKLIEQFTQDWAREEQARRGTPLTTEDQ